jgi:hypothetical protein
VPRPLCEAWTDEGQIGIGVVASHLRARAFDRFWIGWDIDVEILKAQIV